MAQNQFVNGDTKLVAIRARRPATTETLRHAHGKDWKDATPPVKMVREDFQSFAILPPKCFYVSIAATQNTSMNLQILYC